MFRNVSEMFHNTGVIAKTTMLAALSLFVMGVIRVTDTPSGETTVVGIEHVQLAGLTAALVMLIPLVVHLGRLAQRPRAAVVAVAGLSALALITVTSNVRGEDLGIFPAVAGPANLAILGGFVAIAIALRRQAGFGLVLAAGLPLSWIAALPASAVGGTILAAAYFGTIGYLLAAHALRPVADSDRSFGVAPKLAEQDRL
jgi:hypothetical protein